MGAPPLKVYPVDRAVPLSSGAQAVLAPKLGLSSSPDLAPPRSVEVSRRGSELGVDLTRRLARFGFTCREEAEALGAHVFERRRQAAQAHPDEDEPPLSCFCPFHLFLARRMR